MTRIRKPLFWLAVVASLTAALAIAVWVKYKDSLTPDLRNHLGQVLHGESDILGNRAPGELIRYAKRRLEGHPNLEKLALPPLHWLQRRYERPVPPGPLPTLGKGQQKVALPRQHFNASGHPDEMAAGQSELQAVPRSDAVTEVYSSAELASAVKMAKPGQTILMAPGRYEFNTSIKAQSAGSQFNPITLRAAQPGQVTLEFNTEVAFQVSQPYWIFENLLIRGTCKAHAYCEHAFHIFGRAQNVVLRNNRMENFNAHIKVNGSGGQWPDHGLVQFNTLTNTVARVTDRSVTPFDLVGANSWRLVDNLVSNFVKEDGNKVSYGIFMKGASAGGRIERNLVICTPDDMSQPGVRVGISFGGGGTGKPYCRDKRCEVEHSNGLAANNIIAHCNDAGIDVNNASAIAVAHNTVINTAGIDMRNEKAKASVFGNLLDGHIRMRNGAQAMLQMNQVANLPELMADVDQLRLKLGRNVSEVPRLDLVPVDFDGNSRNAFTTVGAMTKDSTPERTVKAESISD